jgi:hypothetical protein
MRMAATRKEEPAKGFPSIMLLSRYFGAPFRKSRRFVSWRSVLKKETIHNEPHRPCSGPAPVGETEQELRVKIEDRIDAKSREFYRKALVMLREAEIPLLVGGAFAFEYYTSISRWTKDFDIFVKAKDAERVLQIFSGAGYSTEVTSPHWLAKACYDGYFVDIIFGGANKVSEVDDEWFRHSLQRTILGFDVLLCPPEEMIWSKAFVMDRDRYDGADVAHLFQALAEKLDWDRLLRRFGAYWHVLLSHLLLFTFIYPSETGRIPDRIMQELIDRMQQELKNKSIPRERICRGSLLSMDQYHIDILQRGYLDAREWKEVL